MKTKKFLYTIITFFMVYFFVDFFFEDTILYVLGAVIWGMFDVLFNIQLEAIGILIGVAILISLIFLFYKTQSGFTEYFILVFMVIFLYVIDFIRMELFSFNTINYCTRYFKITVSILSKILILSIVLSYKFGIIPQKHKNSKKINK